MENLQIYYKQISKYDLLTREEEDNLILRAKFGEEEAKNCLINSNLRFVVSVAKKFVVPNVELQDLIQEGNIGLIKSIDKFDPSRGVKFISYAVWWIKQSMYSFINENSRTVRLSLNQIRSNNAFKKMKQEFEDIGLGPDEIDKFDFYEHVQVSLSRESEGDIPLIETIANQNTYEPDRQLIAESLIKEMEELFRSLSEREVQILKYYYGIGLERAYTLDEVGEKLNLTRERVRQIKELTLNRISLKQKFKKLIRYL
jgi:RNA polymerase primary sigma factor